MGDQTRGLLLGQTVTQISVELGSHSVCVLMYSAQLKHSVMFIILKANKNIKDGKFYCFTTTSVFCQCYGDA